MFLQTCIILRIFYFTVVEIAQLNEKFTQMRFNIITNLLNVYIFVELALRLNQ